MLSHIVLWLPYAFPLWCASSEVPVARLAAVELSLADEADSLISIFLASPLMLSSSSSLLTGLYVARGGDRDKGLRERRKNVLNEKVYRM